MSITYYAQQVGMRGQVLSSLPAYAWRAMKMFWLTARQKGSTFDIGFGANGFKMRFEPMSKGHGARGMFFFRDRYEPLLQFGHKLLKRGDIAFDLGANQGIFTNAFASAVGSDGRVFFVEPIPWQVQRVLKNVEINQFQMVTGIEAAISDIRGEAELNIGRGDTAASIVDEFPGESIQVRTETVDDIVFDYNVGRVQLIKADVEGAEMMALRGAHKVLERDHPILCLEAKTVEDFTEFTEHLAGYGYEPYRFDHLGILHRWEISSGWIDNIFYLTHQKAAELKLDGVVQG